MLHSGDAGGLLELDRSETQETVVPEDTNDNQHSVTFDARALAPMVSAAGRNSPMDVEGAPGAEPAPVAQRRGAHRRTKSEPTEIIAAARAGLGMGGFRRGGPDGGGPTHKRSRSTSHKVSGSYSRMLEPADEKKDVAMWAQEEDLLILKLVGEIGKRWSTIAAQLPGRTDNGVRNRFNRMEKAQELKSTRRADAGYRCRRCGQPKRGHICAALTQGAGPRTAEELEEKAAALTALSAAKIPAFAEQQAAARPRSISEPIPELLVPSYEGDGAPVVAVADVLSAAADGADEEAPLSEEEEEELAQFVRDSPELIERVLDPAVLGADAPAVAGGGLSGSFDPFDEGKLDAVLHELNVSLGGNPPPLLSRLGSLGLEDGAVEFGSLGDLSFRSEQQAAAPTATPTPSPATPLSAQESRPQPVAITTYAPVLSVS